MKKLLLFFSCTLLTFLSYARDFSYEYEGQTLIYTVIDEMDKTCMIKSENKVGGVLEIPEEAMDGEVSFRVTAIGDYAFYYCRSLSSIVIPSSVTSIGDYAFFYCSGLTTMTFPESLTSIGDASFYNCSGLSSVSLPSSVTSIGNNTFSNCTSLSSIAIPSSVTSIGNSAFSNCRSLSSIAIPSSVTSIGDYAFSYCSGLISVSLPSSVTSIGDYTFSNCISLSSIAIPSSVTNIGDYAFSYCSGLISVSLPSSVNSIGRMAFYNCECLSIVGIPSSVDRIGDYSFANCQNLMSVYYNSQSPIEGSVNIFYYINTDATLYVPEVAIDKCKVIDPWRKFGYIRALEMDEDVKVRLSLTSKSLMPSETFTLGAIVVSDNTPEQTVTWSSSDATVAAVDTNGKVKAFAPGTAIITATCGNASEQCEVTVLDLKVVSQGETFTGLSGKNYYIDYENGLLMQLYNSGATLVSPENMEEEIDEMAAALAYSIVMIDDYSYSLMDFRQEQNHILEFMEDVDVDYFELRDSINNLLVPILSEYDSQISTIRQILKSHSEIEPALMHQKKNVKSTTPDKTFSLGLQDLIADIVSMEIAVRDIEEEMSYLYRSICEIEAKVAEDHVIIDGMRDMLDVIIAQHTAYCAEISAWIEENSDTADDDMLQEMLEAIQSRFDELQDCIARFQNNPMDEPRSYIDMIEYMITSCEAACAGLKDHVPELRVKLEFIQEEWMMLCYDKAGMYRSILENRVLDIPDVVLVNGRYYRVTVSDGNIFSGLQRSGVSSLSGCRLTLPKYIKKIQHEAFAINGISTIIVTTDEVPEIDSDCFTTDVYATAALSVPSSLEDSFREHPVWKNFFDTTMVNVSDWEIIQAVVPMLKSRGWYKPWDLTGGMRAAKYFSGLTLSDDRVVGIDLSRSGLGGEFPGELLAFPMLETLNISGNLFNGQVEGVSAYLQQNPDAGSALTELNISGNSFSGNLGIMAACFPNLVLIKANSNCLSDVYPMISEKVTSLDISGQTIDRVIEYDLSNTTVEDLAQQIPTVLVYDHAAQSYSRPLNLKFQMADGFGMTLSYNDGNIGISNVAKQNAYHGESGDIIDVTALDDGISGTNSNLKLKLVFESGDANFDGKVNILDLQTSILYMMEKYNMQPFNFTAANLWKDKQINVQDIICHVNLLMTNSSEETGPYGSSKRNTAMTAVSADARVYVQDGLLVLDTSRPVAAFDVTVSGAKSMDILSNIKNSGMTVSVNRQGDGLRIIGYSLNGNCLPAGITLIGMLEQPAYIVTAMLSDIEANAISVSCDGSTSGIDSVGTTFEEGYPLYDLQGRKVDDRSRRGIFFRKGQKVVK